MKNDKPKDAFRVETVRKAPFRLAWKKKAKSLREDRNDLRNLVSSLELRLKILIQELEDKSLKDKELENIELKVVIEELMVFSTVVRVHGLNAAPFDRARSVLEKYKHG